MDRPSEADVVVAFLMKQGLVLANEQSSKSFGNWLIELADRRVVLRIVRDRGQLFIDLAAAGRSEDFHDMALLREHLAGVVDEDVMSFTEQFAFLQANWNVLVEAVDGPQALAVAADLQSRRLARSKRRLG